MPNPVKIGIPFMVSLNSKTEIKEALIFIYDMTGKMVFNKLIQIKGNSYMLSIAPDEFFSNGMYILQTEINGEAVTKKLIVE